MAAWCCCYWQHYWGENGQLYGDNVIIQDVIMVSTETNVMKASKTTETENQHKGSASSSRQTKTVCRRLCMFLNRLENARDKVGGGGCKFIEVMWWQPLPAEPKKKVHSPTSYESNVLRKRWKKICSLLPFSGKDQDQGGPELTGKISALVGLQTSFTM